jgi:hypothetical protein
VLEAGSGRRLGHDRCSLHPAGGRNLGQAEIKNLGVPTPGYKNVCWLDVPVDDAFGVGGVESVGNLDSKGEQRLQIHRTVADQVLQRLTVEKLHGDERLAIFLTNVVDRADIGMVQGGSCLGLTPETFQSLAVLGHALG